MYTANDQRVSEGAREAGMRKRVREWEGGCREEKKRGRVGGRLRGTGERKRRDEDEGVFTLDKDRLEKKIDCLEGIKGQRK